MGTFIWRKKTGVQLIEIERQRQIDEEGWTPEHDDEHEDGELALVAALYSTPIKLYEKIKESDVIAFSDPWPGTWDAQWDKRWGYGSNKWKESMLRPSPRTYRKKERLDLLIKAGALIELMKGDTRGKRNKAIVSRAKQILEYCQGALRESE